MAARDTDRNQEAARAMVTVWDVFVRFSHWAVALGFFVAFVTEDDLMTLHVWAGYLVGALVVLRLVWGVVGPRHARFADFVAGPRTVWAYLRQLIAFRAPRHLGHSPAGGAMAVALWLGLLVVVWSGMEFYAIRDGRGPLAALDTGAAAASVSVAAPAAADDEAERSGARSDGSGVRRKAGAWKEFHEIVANFLMALVALHVAGVVLACLAHRENLVRAMWDGKKRPE